VPPPEDRSKEPFCFQVNALGYDDYLGRLVVGRVAAGTVKPNQVVKVTHNNKTTEARITGVFAFQGVTRLNLNQAESADIIALSGIEDIGIGDLIHDVNNTHTPPIISVDEPTVAMVFQVNDGPLGGRSGGKFVTSRHLRDRLNKEAYANVSIRIEPGETPDQFRVLGRGELQLAVVIESLRRELFEMCIRTPEVVTRQDDSGIQEPTERLVIDVPAEHLGVVSEMLGKRRATMLDQKIEGSRMRLEYLIPTRGLFGIRNQLLTATRGTAILHSVFEGWTPWTGPIPRRNNGALVSDRTGVATAYALFNLQPRGTLFIAPGENVYEGMIIGEHNRDNDLDVNVCREKKLTNVRAAGKDDNVLLAPPRAMTLELCMEWIKEDEMVEVTPQCIRLRKKVLAANKRPSK
jgi:GTP-binding protein